MLHNQISSQVMKYYPNKAVKYLFNLELDEPLSHNN